jgi:hypothetical protein
LPLSITHEELPSMNKLLPYPFFILFCIVAFNITAFSVLLQMDVLIFNATVYKVIAWLLTAGAWTLAYRYRHK